MARLSYYKDFEDFEIWEYVPDIIKAFPFYLEPITWSHRIRCVFEYFVGYKVYYVKIHDEWAGYCVISNGNNPRYKFSTNEDIIFGRYFIGEKFRGKGLGQKMLHSILDECDIIYNKAYAYVRCTNIASIKTITKLGAKEIERFDILGLTRTKLKHNPKGDFILFQYH